MKKLMIAAAIVCAAMMSQAASLKWGSDTYYWDPANNAKATAIAGGNVVLCLINDGADWKNGVTVLDTGSLVTSGMTAQIGRVQGSSSGSFEWAFADGTLKNGNVLTVLFKDSEGNFSQLAYVDGDGKPSSSLVSDTYTVTGLSGDDSTLDKFAFGSTGNYTAQAVPEPTSGLLLLLGIGAMALRRRRA